MMRGVFVVLTFLVQNSFCVSYREGVASVECGCYRVTDLDVSKVKVFFYNYATDGQENWAYINEAADVILTTNDFDEDQCYNLFIAGFNNNITSREAIDVKCSFSKHVCNSKRPFGIIIEHSAYTALEGNALESYEKSVTFAKSIGQTIGRFIVKLLSKVNINNLNVIGHSLGSHMAGYAAEIVKKYMKPLPVLYTTDPAGPCFDDCPDEHVRSGQADLVINFHCNDVLGTELRTGDYDFVSHDGVTQRDCEGLDEEESIHCSHNLCVLISLAPSFRRKIWESKHCGSYDDYKNGDCDDSRTIKAGFTIVPCIDSEKGNYYFEPETDLTCGNE